MSKPTSLELDDDEKLDYPRPMPMTVPDYPCHATFALTEREFKKMKLDPAEADLGDYVSFTGRACIKHIHPPERDKRQDDCRVEFQICDLDFEDFKED